MRFAIDMSLLRSFGYENHPLRSRDVAPPELWEIILMRFAIDLSPLQGFKCLVYLASDKYVAAMRLKSDAFNRRVTAAREAPDIKAPEGRYVYSIL